MTALTINTSKDKILIVGPIYDQLNKLEKVSNLIDAYDYIVFNGNLCYPYDDLISIQYRIDIMNDLIKTQKVIYNMGDYDFKLLNKLMLETSSIKDWLQSKHNAIIFNFNTQSSLIIVSGGILPKMNKHHLNNNLEISFISNIENKPWHYFYGGAFGYVISNNPLTNKSPQFYNFSAQIGNVYSKNVNVFAQEADQYGLKKTILL